MLESMLCVGIATLGITYLLCYTDGPFNVFHNMRSLLGVEYIYIDDEEEVYRPPTKFFAKLILCHWCTGTWVAILLSVLYVILIRIDALQLIYIIPGSLAISGVIIERIT